LSGGLRWFACGGYLGTMVNLPTFTATPEAFQVIHWQAMWDSLHEKHEPPPKCPACDRTGFYGPRIRPTKPRHYRLCKFCGFFQNVGEFSMTLIATVHGCPHQPLHQILGAPQIQWVRLDERKPTCFACEGQYDAANHVVTRPVDDAKHPWWAVPQGQSYDEGMAYWRRVGLAGWVHL
jgi:hypothetical protein